MAKDLYQTLEVPRSASQQEIRRAFRKKARKHHPDMNPGDRGAEERFKEINAAYEVLSDPEKRKVYDELGEEAEKIGYDPAKAKEYRAWKESAGRPRPGRAQPPGFEEGPIGFDFGDIFGDVFGGFRDRAAPDRPMRGDDVGAEIMIPFIEAIKGGQRELHLRKPDGGEVSITVTIPPGIRDGQKIRITGHGAPGKNGGPAGSLYLSVHVAPHPIFRRVGDDIELDLPVKISEAMFGAEIEIPTIDGPVKLKVPPRSQTLSRLRLRGKGVRRKNARPGDLYARIVVRVPDASRDPAAAGKAGATLDALYPDDMRAELKSAAAAHS